MTWRPPDDDSDVELEGDEWGDDAGSSNAVMITLLILGAVLLLLIGYLFGRYHSLERRVDRLEVPGAVLK